MPMSPSLTFINPAILHRIENGSFLPARKNKTASNEAQERRRQFSPLSITKRCIRYEPNVFIQRKALILKIANALNQPSLKMLMLGGPQGSGKTSLIRGIIELMGSHDEQLLWFDANRHSDFEEIIQFLLHYITQICRSLSQVPVITEKDRTSENALSRLEKLLVQTAQIPILLVLDNIEFLVDAEARFNSYPFKEILNFLLGFPNIKMVLVGERLPYADMGSQQAGVLEIQLEGFEPEVATAFMSHLLIPDLSVPEDPIGSSKPPAAVLEKLIQETSSTTESRDEALNSLCHKTHCQPWLLKIIYYLCKQTKLPLVTLDRLIPEQAAENCAAPLTHFILTQIPELHRHVFQVLCCLRHPVNTATLLTLVNRCYPNLGSSPLSESSLQNLLEHSLLKGLLKVSYPPQEVLERLRDRAGSSLEKVEKSAWYELYWQARKVGYAQLRDGEPERLHQVLRDFYLKEKALEPGQRTLRVKNLALLAEAKYHSNVARPRKSTGQPQNTEEAQEVPLLSKTYLSGLAQPGISLQAPTLADYQKVELGSSNLHADTPTEVSLVSTSSQSGNPTNSEAKPAFLQILQHTAGDLTEAEIDALNLSAEEKQLLKSQLSLGERLVGPLSFNDTPPSPPAPRLLSSSPTPSPTSISDILSQVKSPLESGDEKEKAIQERLIKAVENQQRGLIADELVALAEYRTRQGQYQSALECLNKVLNLKTDTRKETLAELYRLLGMVYQHLFQHKAALSALENAAKKIHQLIYEDDTVDSVWIERLGQVHHSLGEIYAYRNQLPEATAALQEALRWYRSCEQTEPQAEIHFQIASCYEEQDNVPQAIAHYQEALKLDKKHGNDQSAAAALANLGHLHAETQRFTEAIDYFNESLQYDQQSNNLEGQWSTLETLTRLYIDEKNWTLAQNIAKQGLGLATHEQAPLWQATFYTKLAQIAEHQAQWQEAHRYLLQARQAGKNILAKESLNWLEQKANLMQEKEHQSKQG